MLQLCVLLFVFVLGSEQIQQTLNKAISKSFALVTFNTIVEEDIGIYMYVCVRICICICS